MKMKIQIIEDEGFAKYADYDNHEVFLLNRTEMYPLDERVINVPEITEGFAPVNEKFNTLLSEIYNRYGDVEYEVITDDPKKYIAEININGEVQKYYITRNLRIVS